MKLQLRDFQKEDVLLIRQHNYNCIIANAPGTGKTIECLGAIMLDHAKLCPVFIVAPASVVGHWEKECKKWIPWASVHVVKSRTDKFPKRRKHVYITSWSLLQDRALEILQVRPQLIIADEAHFAKNEDATRSQVLYGLCKRTPHKLMLTGTPLINKIEELESLKGLFPEEPLIIRRFLEDVAKDIPPKTRAVLPIQLPRKSEREYVKAQNDFADWLEVQLQKRFDSVDAAQAHRRAMAAEALVKIGYLRRIAGKGKTNAAVDWAARAVRVGEPIVIFAEHTDVIDRISDSLHKQNLRHVKLYGKTPKKRRTRIVESFQDGEVPIFLGSKAAATGITLTRARHLLFVEYFWTSAELDQAEDRIRRIGQKYPTKIWYLHALKTVDDRINKIIERKRRMIDNAIGLEDIKDTPEETVSLIIKSWSETCEMNIKGDISELGLSKPLAPLPKAKNVVKLYFAGKRWNKASVKAWSEMNGYKALKIHHDSRFWTIDVTHTKHFVSGSFRTFSVSKEIKIVQAVRRNKKPGPKRRRA